VLMAGGFQFSTVKARYLACCRAMPGRDPSGSDGVRTALERGVRLGLHCCGCCAGYTAALLAVGVMDLRAMTLASAAIAAERFAQDGERVARIAGGLVAATGIALTLRAVAGAG